MRPDICINLLDCYSEAYDMLISAYQESRELNDEMELLVKDALTS